MVRTNNLRIAFDSRTIYKKNRSKTIKMAGTNNRRIALDSRFICKKTEVKLLKWLEQITEEWHWTVELSAKKQKQNY
jgi:hypothetical protein